MACLGLTLMMSCEGAVSDAGCAIYAENSRGLIGVDAKNTPIGVKRRVLALDDAMKAGCW